MKADKNDIKDQVTAMEVLQHFNVQTRNNYCKCFVHGGEHFKMKIFSDGIVCMSKCRVSLDIFGIVEYFMGCNFQTALSYICEVWNIPNYSEELNEFDKLKFNILQLTKELAKLEQEGKTAVVFNQIVKVDKIDVDMIRVKYKICLDKLNFCNIKFFSGRFAKEINGFVIKKAEKQVEVDLRKYRRYL